MVDFLSWFCVGGEGCWIGIWGEMNEGVNGCVEECGGMR